MLTINTLENALYKILSSRTASQYWVAYSGGLDSHVLLHALCRSKLNINIKVIHIHHGISPHADAWAEHCVDICSGLGVECIVRRVDVLEKAAGRSIEEVAREQRHHVFKEIMQADDCLIMAHHQDDLAETFLSQALRGAGLKGLASMSVERPFFHGTLLRPFLNISRASLRAYALATSLVWQEDESNASERFDRNYLRHQVLPLLIARFPGAQATLARAAQHCAEADALLSEIAQADLVGTSGKAIGTLSVSALLELSQARRNNLLRYWMHQQGFLLPTTLKLTQLYQAVLLARQDASPHLKWRDAEIRRYRDDLYIMSPLSQDFISHALSESLDPHMIIRFRQGGERMRIAGRAGTHSLKKLFQEWQVPPWLRDRIPLIFYKDDLIAVVGYADQEIMLRKDVDLEE